MQTAPLVSFDPQAEINGESIRSVLSAFQVLQQGRKLLEHHGLPTEPQAGQWYPMQAWLDVLADLRTHYGPETLYHVGLQVVRNSVFPVGMATLRQALESLDTAYQTNVRGRNMGYYRVEELGPQQLRVRCHTPNPLEFDCGIITGLARQYRPVGAVRLRVDAETPPAADDQTGNKSFLVSW